MQALGCFFVFFVALIFAFIAAVSNIVRALFGFTRGTQSTGADNRTQSGRTRTNTTGARTENRGASSHTASSKTKIFDDNEGEYVDYEEIKN